MKKQIRLAILLSLILILLLSAFTTVSAEESTNVTWQRYEDGTLMLDEQGNPIAVVPDGSDMPVAYQRDENGSLVLDENGNPIVTESVPAGAEKIKTLVDADRTIDIYLSWVSEEQTFGGTAMLTAVLSGYNDAPCAIQWQTSTDYLEWVDIPGATNVNLYVVVTEENYLNYWRVVVTVAE